MLLRQRSFLSFLLAFYPITPTELAASAAHISSIAVHARTLHTLTIFFFSLLFSPPINPNPSIVISPFSICLSFYILPSHEHSIPFIIRNQTFIRPMILPFIIRNPTFKRPIILQGRPLGQDMLPTPILQLLAVAVGNNLYPISLIDPSADQEKFRQFHTCKGFIVLPDLL